MITYLRGNFTEITPAHLVVECGGVGYLVHISLHSYSLLRDKSSGIVLVHPIYREDAQQLFGFMEESERTLFRLLIGVSGVGATTARMVLSTVSPEELERAILSGDLFTLKKVKGIGTKSAERILIDLRDKVGKGSSTAFSDAGLTVSSAWKEAEMALIALGFARQAVEKALTKLKAQFGQEATVDQLVREGLKHL
jgi:holliday junction DNA helicase RuvA